MEARNLDFKKYILVFILTSIIFGSGFLISNLINKEKINRLISIQQDFNIDMLSLETQFAILKEASCDNMNESTITLELYNISQKLDYIANTLGKNDPTYVRLKKQYVLLELKHWMLLKQAADDCNFNFVFINYFYSNKQDCPECENQGLIISHLRQKYFFLRVYSYDYNLELSALDALKSLYSFENKREFPVLIINDKLYSGFMGKDELEEIILEEYSSFGQTGQNI